MISQNIFRAYDIRGTYPNELNAEAAELIGKAFGTYIRNSLNLENPKVLVGRDCRIHGPELHKAFISGLLSTGCHVRDLGLSPSPFLYFVNCHEGYDAGCSITASHNPAEYNGFKLVLRNAHAVFGDEIQKIYQLIQENNYLLGEGKMIQTENDPFQAYFEKLSSIFQFKKFLKVVVDTGNGIAGNLYPQMIRKFGHEVSELYTELDGTFPNHEPDPIIEANLEDLKRKVIEEGSTIGIAFDGDGDRLGIVDEKGQFITADQLMMLFSRDVLSRHPESPIVATVSNSQVLFDKIREWGGKPIMCEVGHSYVENSMTENKAILGSEQSGHFFLPESYYPFDDALVAACRLLQIISDAGKPVSEIFDEFPKTFAVPEMRPYCPDDKKFKIIEKVVEHFKDKYPSTTIDGIRMDFGNGAWAGIRVSNTSPRISIIMEAQSESDLEKVKTEVLGHLKSYSEIDFSR